MKKVLFPILALVLAFGLAIPMASVTPAAANGATIDLPVTYRDFHAYGAASYGHPDFENWCCGMDPDIVQGTLGGDGKPVYAGDTGNPSVHGKSWFDMWYNDTLNYNLQVSGSLTFVHDGTNYVYSNSSFFPLDDQGFGKEGGTHNYHFTMELHTTFTYIAEQEFSFTGDDDVWVFINNSLVIDLGGVHGATTASVDLDSLGLTEGETYDFDLFFAERHTTQSNFHATTNIALEPAANPDIEITKSTTWTGYATVGDTIDYTYDVENTGDVVLDAPEVEDMIGGLGPYDAAPIESGGYNVGDDDPQDGNFDTGEVWQFELDYKVTEGDLDNCKLHNVATATAYYEGEPVSDTDELDVDLAKIIILCAGQFNDVGTVTAVNDGTALTVTYQTTGGWVITETHLYVGKTNPNDDVNHNPLTSAPGQFPYDDEDADPPGVPDTEVTYVIPLEDIDSYHMLLNKKGKPTGVMVADGDPGIEACNDIYIAAHAVVQKVTVITPAPYYASTVIDYDQGLKKGGGLVNLGRSDPEQGLEFEAAQSESSFFSLGFGGWIIVGFDCPIRNGEGDDVRVIEDTWGSGYPLETADVYASQDGTNWTYLGEADNTNSLGIHTTSSFDLGPLPWAKYIKIVDTTDPGPHNNNADGYDLNAVESLQDCIEIEEETAWAGGECDQKENVQDYPGANWATYFIYHVMLCPAPNGD